MDGIPDEAGLLGRLADMADDAPDADALVVVGSEVEVDQYAAQLGLAHAVPTAGGLRVVALAAPSSQRWLLLAPVSGDGPEEVARAVQRAVAECPPVGSLVIRLPTLTDAAVAGRALEAALIAGAPTPRTGPGGPQSVTVVAPRVAEIDRRAAQRRAQITARAVNWTRRLVDAPANQQSPQRLAEAVAVRVEASDVPTLSCRVLRPEPGTWPAVCAVAGGSDRDPAIVRLSLNAAAGDPIALVGKGVTFDAGGLDVKSPAEMANMRRDMAGAASVASAVIALAELGVPLRVEATLVLTDNMLGGAAMRPGDVIEHADGSTTEIGDTDSEGRLILADAFLETRRSEPLCIVDVATLTGGGGLGPERWAVLASDRRLAGSLLSAGEAVGEPGWELPLVRGYRRYLDSAFADRTNSVSGLRYGFDTLLATCFLADFAGPVPFAHVDISAVAARDGQTCDDVWPEGATGNPTRMLIQWLEEAADG